MSFYSDYVADQTGQPEPVGGPNSPHWDRPHHETPEPPKVRGRVVMRPDGKGEINEHPELERSRAEAGITTAPPSDGVLTSGGNPVPDAPEEDSL